MKELQIFSSEEYGDVRTLSLNGEPWFVAKDICDILEIKNTTDTIKRLDDDEVARFNLGGLSGETNIVNEYGLYSLVLGSRKPEAKRFKRWITHDVVPSIRKHGMYAADELLANPDLFIKALEELKAERAARIEAESNVSKQKQIIGELKPRADYTDRILKNKGLVTITQIAKDYGLTGTKLNKLLHDLGVQYKQSGQWLLYAKHQGKGYTHSETTDITRSDGRLDIVMNTKWTQKGRLFLYDLLKANGILPDIEKEAS